MGNAKLSAGLMMYKNRGTLEVFLVHPGGPFWVNKNEGAWSIPKGEPNLNEEHLVAAKREFFEETGIKPPSDNNLFIDLGEVTQKSGKVVRAWAFRGDFKGKIKCTSNATIEYPKDSGKMIEFPEVDQGEFFLSSIAKEKINPAQIELINRLELKVSVEKIGKQASLDLFNK